VSEASVKIQFLSDKILTTRALSTHYTPVVTSKTSLSPGQENYKISNLVKICYKECQALNMWKLAEKIFIIMGCRLIMNAIAKDFIKVNSGSLTINCLVVLIEG
jgi:hypothetical protein